jgi:hypothetical protein
MYEMLVLCIVPAALQMDRNKQTNKEKDELKIERKEKYRE